MTVTDDDYWVCADCLPVIANGDYTQLDNYYVSVDQSGEISLEDICLASVPTRYCSKSDEYLRLPS